MSPSRLGSLGPSLHRTASARRCGLRVSELVSLRIDQIDRQVVANIHLLGKDAASACYSPRDSRPHLEPTFKFLVRNASL